MKSKTITFPELFKTKYADLISLLVRLFFGRSARVSKEERDAYDQYIKVTYFIRKSENTMFLALMTMTMAIDMIELMKKPEMLGCDTKKLGDALSEVWKEMYAEEKEG